VRAVARRRGDGRYVCALRGHAICANRAPDHTTIARFRQRHEAALAEMFGEVLALCGEAGLVRAGVIAVDGTKVHDASHHAARDYEQIAREILEHDEAIDARKTSALATRAAMSFPSRCRRRGTGSGGYATRVGALTIAAPGRRGRSPGRAPSGSRRASAAWRRTPRSPRRQRCV
jgi:hypothetical protein